MTTHQSLYEALLCHYTNQLESIELLKQYRPYFELIPSLRRPTQSLITVPLPVVKLAHSGDRDHHLQLQCDLALLMCDPEWKIKTGREIFVFMHRPNEDFSGLLNRWRQVEVTLGSEYYWLLPLKYHHIMNDKGDHHYPLFVTVSYTPERIKRGLTGAGLPFVSVDMPELYLAETEENKAELADLENS